MQIRAEENWMSIGDFNCYRSPDDQNRDGAKLGYGCVQLNNKPLGFGGNFP
jgi:hypothetical protein